MKSTTLKEALESGDKKRIAHWLELLELVAENIDLKWNPDNDASAMSMKQKGIHFNDMTNLDDIKKECKGEIK